jgi:hypothetical protein
MTTTIQGLPASRAVARESTVLHRTRRYEEGLRAVLASRPLELHHEPIGDAEHLIAVQYVAACEAFEAAQRAPSKAAVTPDTAPQAPAAAPAPREVRRPVRRRRARRKALPAASQESAAPAAKRGRPPKAQPAA